MAPVDQLNDHLIVSKTILVILLAIPAAYALAVKPIKKWTDAMFFFLSHQMLPAVASLLPLYIFARYLGLLDNISHLLILYTAMNLPIAVWMMRSFLTDIPVGLFEAAAIDGAGLIRTLRGIIVPIISPRIATTALICSSSPGTSCCWPTADQRDRRDGAGVSDQLCHLAGSVPGQGVLAATIVSLPSDVAGFALHKTNWSRACPSAQSSRARKHMPALNQANLRSLSIPVPSYDRSQVKVGIVHFGVSGFPSGPSDDVCRSAHGAGHGPRLGHLWGRRHARSTSR